MKRTPLRRKARKPAKRSKSPDKGYKPPQWFLDIKPGSHGSNPAQKRLWRLVSEYVRQRDYQLYGKCVSCDHYFRHWSEAQAGHWLPYSVCHSFYKFDPTLNIHAQCASCNTSLYRSGAHIGHEMGEEIMRRYGKSALATIKQDNERFRGMKMEVWAIVDFAARLRPDLAK